MLKKPLIVANWKANKTIKEALEWLDEFRRKLKMGDRKSERAEIVICPPFTALEALKLSIVNSRLSIKLGAQDVSSFPDGPLTGEVSARMLAELVDYVIIGHSERKKNFGENVKTASKKIKMASEVGTTPILCASDLDEVPKEIPDSLHLLYEPPSAISQDGAYRPETPPKAQKTITEWRTKLKNVDKFLYGGSVNPGNIAQFLAQPDIDGVVVGHASLDPNSFWEVINNVPA